MASRSPRLMTLVVACASCVGSIDVGQPTGAGDPGPGQTPGAVPGAAQPGAAPVGPASTDQALTCNAALRGTTELPVRRLTKPEIVASLTALFGNAIMNDQVVRQSLGQIPEQAAVTNTQFDNSIVDVEGLEAAALSIADAVVAIPGALGQVLPGCTPANVAACTDALAISFATRAFRRPPTKQTQQSIRDLVAKIGGVDGVRNGIVRVLISPYFHQHIELGDVTDEAKPARLKLTPYEVAERLSFQLTGGPPDDALTAAAAAGKLGDVAAVRAQAQRLLGSPAARENLRRMVSDWLTIRQIADPDAVVAKDLKISNVGLGQEAQEELLRFVAHEVFDKKASLRSLFTDNVAFAYTDRLAKDFGVARSDAAQMVGNGLGGLLLRPATLMSGTSVTSPILRSVFIHRKVLCEQLPEPDPATVNSRLADTSYLNHKDFSNREFFTMLTSPGACSACHAMINPLGYALESFGPLGAPRPVEILYDQSGPTKITHTIDTAVDDLRLDPNRVMPATGAADAVAQIAKSGKARGCFDGAIVINSRYRPLDETDNCLMNELGSLQNTEQPLVDLLVQSVANDGIFWKSAAGVQP